MILRKKAFVLWIAAAVLLLAVAGGLFFLLTDNMLTMEDLSVLAEENALPSKKEYVPPTFGEDRPVGGRPDVEYLKLLPEGLLNEVEITLDPEEEEIAFAFHPEEGKLILLYSQEDDATWNATKENKKGLPFLLELKVDYKTIRS